MKKNKRRRKGKIFAAVFLLVELTLLSYPQIYLKAEQVVTEADEMGTDAQDKMDEKAENKMAEKEDTIVSVLGDSISTYENYTSYKIHQGYYTPSNLKSVNNTWWMRYINEYGYRLGVNDSIGGSRVARVSEEKNPQTCMSNQSRIDALDDNGTPDIILFFGGTNDMIEKTPLGDAEHPSYGNVANFADAYYTTLFSLKKAYPDAKIICLTPFANRFVDDDVCNDYCSIITKLCYRNQIECIDLRSAGILEEQDLQEADGVHPNQSGMQKIYDRLIVGEKRDTFFCDGTFTYYLQHDGSIMRDTLSYDPQGTGLIYLDSAGHMAFDSFQYCKNVGYTCYFNTFGRAYFDQTTFWRGHAYYLDQTGRMQNAGWFMFADGGTGYANKDGTLLTDCVAPGPDGKDVYFFWNGRMQQ
ncbi:MAG: SGNH/GDSL hydrolase family protein [Lachnospiraceae bacterium]|nr:SGNH/GDSL hydrolase family protein [Lachnospiraceae bacterium]